MSAVHPQLVSVIIPCYNQAHFLSEAIASALAQTHPRREVIVVDDGSTDGTSEVAARYPDVRCVQQPNRGLSAARNAGLREGRGAYVVFLDSDDRLLPGALADGVACLEAHPECAFASGRFRLIAEDGSPLPTWEQPVVEREHDLELLRRNYVGVPATVIYRRVVFDQIGGFETSLRACEDLELYLRVARQFPIAAHGALVAEYRQHGASMTRKAALMLGSSVALLRSQRALCRGDRRREEARRTGIRRYQDYYGEPLINEVRRELRPGGSRRRALRNLLVLLWYHPRGFARHTGQKLYCLLSGAPKERLTP